MLLAESHWKSSSDDKKGKKMRLNINLSQTMVMFLVINVFIEHLFIEHFLCAGHNMEKGSLCPFELTFCYEKKVCLQSDAELSCYSPRINTVFLGGGNRGWY